MQASASARVPVTRVVTVSRQQLVLEAADRLERGLGLCSFGARLAPGRRGRRALTR